MQPRTLVHIAPGQNSIFVYLLSVLMFSPPILYLFRFLHNKSGFCSHSSMKHSRIMVYSILTHSSIVRNRTTLRQCACLIKTLMVETNSHYSVEVQRITFQMLRFKGDVETLFNTRYDRPVRVWWTSSSIRVKGRHPTHPTPPHPSQQGAEECRV